jgi:hypothetical protein
MSEKKKSSPITGQEDGLQDPSVFSLEGEGSKVGSGGSQDKAQETSPQSPPVTDKDDEVVERLSSLMKKKGFKSVSELVEWAENLEKKNTELSQDVQRLASVVPPGVPPVSPAPAPGYVPQFIPPQQEEELDLPENPVDIVSDKENLKRFVKKFKSAVLNEVRKEFEMREYNRYLAELHRVRSRNPAEFDNLRPLMLQIHNQTGIQDVETLYDMAKKAYDQQMEVWANVLKKKLGLDAVDTEKLKGLVSRIRQAPVTSSATEVNMQERDIERESRELQKAIMDAEFYSE